MNYEDKLAVIKVLKDRLDILENKIQNERVKNGKCPHSKMLEATTFIDRKEGRRVYICKMCGQRIEQPVISKEE